MLTVPLLRFGLRRVLGYSHLLTNQQGARANVAPITAACFHLSVGNAAKLFVESENKHAHSVLEQSLKPYQLIRLDDIKASTQNLIEQRELPELVLNACPETTNYTIEELLHAFTALTRYCTRTNTCISDERFNQFCQLFAKQCHQLDDDQLLSTLRQLLQLPEVSSTRAPNYMELWNSLDIECCRRIERWSTNELLLACDAWYALGLARISQYVWEAICKVGRKIRRLKPEQLVQSMFYCNLIRRPVYDMIDYEVRLLSFMDDMSLQELGVMSMGFFKTQTAIRNPQLLAMLYKRLEAELDTVDDITLVAITKVLRYSSKLEQVPHLNRLLDLLQKQVPRLSLLSCLHIALFGVELQCCNDDVLELVLHRFNREIDMARLKDMERICLAMGVFNYNSGSGVVQELCAKILQKLETKIDEIMRHPRAFVSCVHYLSLFGYYKEEMISSVLEQRFIDRAYNKNFKLGREMFNLDSFAKINLHKEGYAGNQLSHKMRRIMGKVLTQYIPERNPKYKLNATDRILMEVKEASERIFRPCTFKHILPHFDRPDVVLCYDNVQRKALPLADSCPEDYSGDILTRSLLLGDAERPEVDTVAVVVAGWNNVVKDKNRFTGIFDMKLKQLHILGHKPIVIYWHEWRAQETPIDRQQFLKRKLTSVINF